MSVIAQPIVTVVPPSDVGVAVSVDALRTTSPLDPLHEGCPVKTKRRTAIVEKGVPAAVAWQIRDRLGRGLDLSSVLPPTPDSVAGYATVKARLSLADVVAHAIHEVDGTTLDPATGSVSFSLPAPIYNQAGVYRAGVGVIGLDGKPVVIDNGLIFVESGLWGNSQQEGPPGLTEIRQYILDFKAQNDFLRAEEFDDGDIANAIIAPVRTWNETPPYIAQRTCQNFEFREAWIKGIIGNLCRTAAVWYLRNKMQTTHGGISVDDRNKNAEYMQQSKLYLEEFVQFAKAKKVAMNISNGYGTLSSPYGY